MELRNDDEELMRLGLGQFVLKFVDYNVAPQLRNHIHIDMTCQSMHCIPCPQKCNWAMLYSYMLSNSFSRRTEACRLVHSNCIELCATFSQCYLCATSQEFCDTCLDCYFGHLAKLKNFSRKLSTSYPPYCIHCVISP